MQKKNSNQNALFSQKLKMARVGSRDRHLRWRSNMLSRRSFGDF